MDIFRHTGDAFYFFFMQVIVKIGKQLITVLGLSV